MQVQVAPTLWVRHLGKWKRARERLVGRPQDVWPGSGGSRFFASSPSPWLDVAILGLCVIRAKRRKAGSLAPRLPSSFLVPPRGAPDQAAASSNETAISQAKRYLDLEHHRLARGPLAAFHRRRSRSLAAARSRPRAPIGHRNLLCSARQCPSLVLEVAPNRCRSGCLFAQLPWHWAGARSGSIRQRERQSGSGQHSLRLKFASLGGWRWLCARSFQWSPTTRLLPPYRPIHHTLPAQAPMAAASNRPKKMVRKRSASWSRYLDRTRHSPAGILPSWPQVQPPLLKGLRGGGGAGSVPMPLFGCFAWGKVPLRPWFSLPRLEPPSGKIWLFAASTCQGICPGVYEFRSEKGRRIPQEPSRVACPAAGNAVITRRQQRAFP